MTRRPPSASIRQNFHRVGEGELRDGQSSNTHLVLYLDVLYQLVAPFARSSLSTCGSAGQAELIHPSRQSVKVTESESKPPTDCVDYAAGTVAALIAALPTARTPQEATKPAPYPDLDNHARLGQSALIAALHSARAPQEPTQPAPYPDLDGHARLAGENRC